MATSRFQAFTEEVERRVGSGNTELLRDIDLAMNSKDAMPRFLDFTEAEAKALAAKSDAGERQFMSYLAFLNELAYRREFGPALWERASGVVPSLDFLPPTSGQVRASRMPLYRLLCKVWNWALIIIVGGVFPMMIMPLCGMKVFGAKFNGHGALSLAAVSMMCAWIVAAAIGAICFCAARAMRTSER